MDGNKIFIVSVDGRPCRVTLNGIMAHERLTPKLARRAARAAVGHEDALVIDQDYHYGYRLYPNSARKITPK